MQMTDFRSSICVALNPIFYLLISMLGRNCGGPVHYGHKAGVPLKIAFRQSRHPKTLFASVAHSQRNNRGQSPNDLWRFFRQAQEEESVKNQKEKRAAR